MLMKLLPTPPNTTFNRHIIIIIAPGALIMRLTSWYGATGNWLTEIIWNGFSKEDARVVRWGVCLLVVSFANAFFGQTGESAWSRD